MRLYFYFISLFFSVTLCAQSIPQVLKKLNKETIPYIKVNELHALAEKINFVFLDAREPKEYEVSHIQDAILVGFNYFNSKKVEAAVKDKNTNIIVYCSIGVRSEQIGEKLKKLGYKNLHNLYGGIFEYKNSGGQVVNNQNEVTDSVHTFNKTWSLFLTKGIKVYEN
ncbi:rhodanese-like domain-containing protein [Flavobacterium sp. ACAM 123]|jgi:rhodanese-related sulfurtransferase|uniref:rhodanese-like domain-containing protein n=1 Tax=Flavobacterium sp. ACAM 123 TaxID=1189620 RepID=UPI0002F0CD77|nr:rhodanese-like domain-containing protein [Flavobacterium sp. ACAM 123]